MRNHIVYLASGGSRRFGGNKLLHPLEGKPMFQWGLEALWEAVKGRSDCAVTVVSRYAAIRQKAEALGFRAVDCPESHKGVSYTIRAGLEALGTVEPEDRLVFLVADQPYIRAASVQRLLDLEGDCACLAWGDRPGNPVRFPARLLPALLALEGDRGGRTVLRNHPPTLVQAEDPRELEDIDTKQAAP